MKSNILPYILLAFLGAILIGAWGLWQFNAASKRDFEQSARQYAETMGQLDKYAALRQFSSAPMQAGSLFAQVNQLGVELGLSRRVETLRPSRDSQKGHESLDVQVKSLYLAEFLRFLQAVEDLDQITVERMSLARSASRLLELEMRISRASR